MLNGSLFVKTECPDANITRVDFCPSAKCDRLTLADGFAEYLKTQRLHKAEIDEWNKYILDGVSLPENFKMKLIYSFSEGILKDDLSTIDDDALTGTCGQLIFHWLRSEYYGSQILWRSPEFLTESSKEKGIDYFEILGNQNDANSLYFIVWEIKATDVDVTTRTNEIYQMHKKRSARLIRGLEMQLSLQYPEDQFPVLGKFVQQLLDHWISDSPSKRIGGTVIFDTEHKPQDVFTTFHKQFPKLSSATSRQVILISIPDFANMRKDLWKNILQQMS